MYRNDTLAESSGTFAVVVDEARIAEARADAPPLRVLTLIRTLCAASQDSNHSVVSSNRQIQAAMDAKCIVVPSAALSDISTDPWPQLAGPNCGVGHSIALAAWHRPGARRGVGEQPC